jgi:acetyl-CoA carboxylase carboxyltransferase component
MQMLKQIQNLIDKGLSAYHISQLLKANGKRVYCFGSYYTTGRTVADRVCFYETDNGVKCGLVAKVQS